MSHVDASILGRISKLTIGGAIILILSFIYQVGITANPQAFTSPTSATTTTAFYSVVRVVDGDTIVVSLDNVEEKIRLIGINTPETVDPRRPVQCFGKEASEQMKRLVESKLVRLEYDDSQSYRDTYGRILAYVYTEDGQMVNRKMIADGYAYEYTYMVPYAYQSEFRDLQRFAKTNGRGLWSDATCNGEK